MSLVPNKSYKLKIIMNQMENINSSEEFVDRFRHCFPVVWYRIQYYHDMDMADKCKRNFERIPEPKVYVEHLYRDAVREYEKEQ